MVEWQTRQFQELLFTGSSPVRRTTALRYIFCYDNPLKSPNISQTFPKHFPNISQTFPKKRHKSLIYRIRKSQTFPKHFPNISQTFPKSVPSVIICPFQVSSFVRSKCHHLSVPSVIICPLQVSSFVRSCPRLFCIQNTVYLIQKLKLKK